MFLRSILLVALVSVLSSGISRADDESKLPGSKLTVEDAIAKSNVVLVGELMQSGPLIMTEPGQSIHLGNRLKISKSLLSPRRGEVSVCFNVNSRLGESGLSVGSSYIFFAVKNAPDYSDPYTAIKILTNSEENLKAVVSAILQAKAKTKLDEIEKQK